MHRSCLIKPAVDEELDLEADVVVVVAQLAVDSTTSTTRTQNGSGEQIL
jgi:hypothetical protein